MRNLLREESGAESVELALVLPLFMLTVLATMQLALIGMMRYEVKYLASLAARELAVNPDTTDSSLLSFVEGQNMPLLTSSNITTLTTSPACPSLTSGHCRNRPSGSEVTVEMVYDTSNIYFVPSFFAFSLGSTSVGAHVSIMVE
ncbi:MAG TPA: TadE family protein [Chloroflexota bacterium]|nr:TadE family protein [Chloroflexota bacterium]